MKKLFIISGALLVLATSGAIYAVASNPTSYNESNIAPKWGITDDSVKMKADNSGEEMPPLVTNPEPYYKANNELTKSNLYNINKEINKEKLKEENAELKSTTSMTYKEFLKSEGITDADTSISPDRLVWVVKIHYPDGIQVKSDRLKNGAKSAVIKNAMRTILYDAKTGDFISATDSTIK